MNEEDRVNAHLETPHITSCNRKYRCVDELPVPSVGGEVAPEVAQRIATVFTRWSGRCISNRHICYKWGFGLQKVGGKQKEIQHQSIGTGEGGGGLTWKTEISQDFTAHACQPIEVPPAERVAEETMGSR